MRWQEVAQQDQALRASVDNASEALAQHRYQNTIAAGVSFREYARQCGVDERQVRAYARAQEVRCSAPHLSISDALVKASTSAEQADVIEAVADARGLSMKNVQLHHKDEVRRIRAIARERSECEGTSVREEAEKLAQMRVRRESADESIREASRARVDLRYMELEKHLLGARRHLRHAMTVDVACDSEMTELLVRTLSGVQQLVDLVNLKLSGASDVDWDAELARLGDVR